MFPNLGMSEILLILVIALVVFGPRKLPEIGKSLGKTINEFRRASLTSFSELENVTEVAKEVAKEEVKEEDVQVAKVTQEKEALLKG
ncbi:MAG: Sec-independent protein translocase protein TatAd [Pelotomaculum sp. PtaB.Bin013]|uniref:Sec-independent protein translocase protein TatA n=1 Tax=Pelotomaculum isophthalicicum JI TaxID=947010 RepID=A0A9X4JV04_9FIRM|nr:twin-arginine translocase TatA/TatE family subunit [Pelotomaculum isophthalicicum]MDF9407331.1 twin-arginine translocase TatA/TatE family subunit [Pelotomaculum isophthalicicum JI]OPX91936.1 MAG: Sec-independent protein translocase protein TatAd [Pelotomaculum sp. PtaB.Bin013]